MKIRPLLVVLFSLMVGAVYAQNTFKQVNPDITYTVSPSKYVLGGLVVDGVSGFDPDLLQSIAGLEIGATYEVPGADLSEVVRRYWGQKLFSDVSLTADSIVGNTIYLHVHLKAQPRISSIVYSGVKKSEREALEKSIGLRVGGQITQDMVNRAKIIIKRYFDDKGFKNAAIDIRMKDDVTKENNVLIDIDIDKSNKVKVEHIYITGVTRKEASKLKRAMKKTREKSLMNLLRSKKFLPEKYEEDKANVISRLNAWGYRDAIITTDSVAATKSDYVNVYINLDKGRKYYIRNVNWVGNTVYPTVILQNILQLKRGDIYNQTLLSKRLNEDDDAVRNLYYNNGYVFNVVEPVETTIDGDSVDLEMRVSEGRQARFNRVNISGNTRVYENVIRRELRTKPGDLFGMEAIKRSVMDLSQMNQFDPEALGKAMSSAIKPDPQNGTVDISYPLTPKGGDQFQISAG